MLNVMLLYFYFVQKERSSLIIFISLIKIGFFSYVACSSSQNWLSKGINKHISVASVIQEACQMASKALRSRCEKSVRVVL